MSPVTRHDNAMGWSAIKVNLLFSHTVYSNRDRFVPPPKNKRPAAKTIDKGQNADPDPDAMPMPEISSMLDTRIVRG